MEQRLAQPEPTRKKRHPLDAPFLAMVAHFDEPVSVRALTAAGIRCALAHIPRQPSAGRFVEWLAPNVNDLETRMKEYHLSDKELTRFESGEVEPSAACAECPMPGFRLDRKDVEVAWNMYAQTDYWVNIPLRDGSSVKRRLGPTLSICVNDLALRSYDEADPSAFASAEELRAWRKARGGNAVAYALPLEVADLFDRFGAWYGLFDIDRPHEIGFGTLYVGTRFGEFTWRRELEHLLWYDAEEQRRDHVRGLYWGQYFGPRLAEKLDPDGAFIAEFTGQPWPGTEFLQPIVKRYDSGGLFLALSRSPLMALEYVVGFTSLAIPAAALHRQFRTQGLYL